MPPAHQARRLRLVALCVGLACVAAAVSLAWFVVLTNVVGVLRRFLTADRVRRVIDATMGTLLVGLGVRLAVQ